MRHLYKLLGLELQLWVGKIQVGFASKRNNVHVGVRHFKT